MRRRLLPSILFAAAAFLPRSAESQIVGGGISVFENCGVGDMAMYLGLKDDPKVEGRQVLTGPAVQINCEDVRLFADEIAIDGKLVIATGNVVFSQQGFSVSASRAEIDRKTRLGVFFDASGVATITNRPVTANPFGTMAPQVIFYGERIEKTGDRTYRVSNGAFTTCEQPTPRWQIVGSNASVTLDERVILRNAVFKVKNVPVAYLPFLYYPLGEDDRSTGFLIPSYSNSTFQGSGISNAFFWAMARWQDLILKHTWFSKAGQAMSARYRFTSAPGSDGAAEISMIAEPDQIGEGGIVTTAGERSVRFNGRVSQGLPRGFRLVGGANLFSNLVTERLYQQDLSRATERERYFNASLSGNLSRFTRITITADQSDYFSGVDRASRRGTLPRASLSFDRPGRRLYFGLVGETAYLVNQHDLNEPATDQSLLRFDAMPTIRAPLSRLPWLDATTAASWRVTHWMESRDLVTGLQLPVRLTRNLFEAQARMVGPKLSRVWSPENSYARRIKHLIEPEFTFRWFSPFDDVEKVIQHDHVDSQQGGTTTLTYGLTNRIMVRRQRETGPGEVRQILSVSLTQTYSSNQLATAVDPAFQSQVPGTFTPIKLAAIATPAEDVSANFQTEIDPEFRRPRYYTLSGTINRQQVQFSGGWTRTMVMPGFDPETATHFLNTAVGVRPLDGRVQGRYEFNFDVKNRFLLQQRILFSYSAQCCGFNVDYQTMGFRSFPGVPDRTDRRFGISFTLAGIGSFSNPLGSFGNNSGR